MMSPITSSASTFHLISEEIWGPLVNATRSSWHRGAEFTLGPYNVANRIQRPPIRLPVAQHEYLVQLIDFSVTDDSRLLTSNRFIPSIVPIQDIFPELWDPINAEKQDTWPERVDFACRPINPWNEIPHISAWGQQRHRSGVFATFSSIQAVFPDLWDQVDNSPQDPWPKRNIASFPVQKRPQPAPIARPFPRFVVANNVQNADYDDDDESTETASDLESDSDSEWENDFESDWSDSGVDSWSDNSSVSSEHSDASR